MLHKIFVKQWLLETEIIVYGNKPTKLGLRLRPPPLLPFHPPTTTITPAAPKDLY